MGVISYISNGFIFMTIFCHKLTFMRKCPRGVNEGIITTSHSPLPRFLVFT